MTSSPFESQTIVIGAGPAGLAVGACLKQENIPYTILEQNDRVASAWHHHYDRLHLHTDKRNSELPFLPFPKDYPRYISRSQLIDYLESYTQKFQLDIRFQQEVISARSEKDHWAVQTQDNLYRTTNLVIATGCNHKPILPAWHGQNSFKGQMIHSSQYKNGEPFKGKKVLVVGFGNSGGEIAIDLWEHGAQVSMAVRNAVNVIPRELFGIPVLSIAILLSKLPPRVADAINAPILRIAIGDITKYGLRKLSYGPLTQIQRDGHIPLVDIGTINLIRNRQVTVYEGIKEFIKDGVIFNDGKQASFDAVILATGYRPRVIPFLTGISAPLYNENGMPLSSGHETKIPGLYFCGYYVAPTGMLREIGIEAKRISRSTAGKKI
jgi:cation diffusion facilitator CzcD-associated flavoprotein CzcO